MWVKPKDGACVRHPNKPYRMLKAEGENVPDCPYWWRRIVRQDCVLMAVAVDKDGTVTVTVKPKGKE